ncbi:uncharacterized protein [Nicotiana tomentosiformis]|uniref:uncharacterized protein n=1 Tax=Nicotiana tomentosiformis TaxID=4098 RepID=UPI00388C6E18
MLFWLNINDQLLTVTTIDVDTKMHQIIIASVPLALEPLSVISCFLLSDSQYTSSRTHSPLASILSYLSGPEVNSSKKAILEYRHNFKEIMTPSGSRFMQILSVGIRGSALGPQFVVEALAPDNPPLL